MVFRQLQLPPREASSDPRPVALALRPHSDSWFLLEHAADWAERLGERLDLVTVVPRPGLPFDVPEHSAVRPAGRRRETRLARTWLERLMKSIPSRAQGTVLVLDGDPVTALGEASSRYSLLVVGRSTRTGLSSLLRPSVSRRLAQRCSVPVMAVGGRRPRSELVAVLPLTTPPRLEGLRWVRRLFPQARVVPVHLKDGDGVGGAVVPGRFELPGAVIRDTGIKTGRVLTPFGAGRVVAGYASHLDADVVVAPAPERRGLIEWLFGSLTDGLIWGCPCTLLVVPARPAQRWWGAGNP